MSTERRFSPLPVVQRPAGLPLIKGVHHHAFRCRDAAQTRQFYEGLLGMPLAGAFRLEESPESGESQEYIHIFFRYADGNLLGFFDWPDTVEPDHFSPKDAFELHIAFEVADEQEQDRIKAQLETHGFFVVGPLDHHFCKSIYTFDPNGIPIEFTYRVPEHDAIFDEARSDTDQTLAEWAMHKDAVKSARLGYVPERQPFDKDN